MVKRKRKPLSDEAKSRRAKVAKLAAKIDEDIPNELDEMKPLVEKVCFV